MDVSITVLTRTLLILIAHGLTTIILTHDGSLQWLLDTPRRLLLVHMKIRFYKICGLMLCPFVIIAKFRIMEVFREKLIRVKSKTTTVGEILINQLKCCFLCLLLKLS